MIDSPDSLPFPSAYQASLQLHPAHPFPNNTSPSLTKISTNAPDADDCSQVGKDDDKTDRLYSVESSQSMTEILKNNRQALIAELTDKEGNDTILTKNTQHIP